MRPVSDVLTQLSENMAAVVAAAEPSVVRIEARRRIPASGVAWKEKGIVIAAHHTVQQEDGIAVIGQTGERWDAELVGRDPSTDLAVLKLTSGDLTPADWAAPEVGPRRPPGIGRRPAGQRAAGNAGRGQCHRGRVAHADGRSRRALSAD